MEVCEKLNLIFREVFSDASLSIRHEMTANDVEGWDSFSHITLILAIEAGFGIKFTQKELISFKNVGDIIQCIRHKTAG